MPRGDFDPSPFSPAGQSQLDWNFLSNVTQDPVGAWSAIRRSWGVQILIGGLGLLIAAALMGAFIHWVT